jgi:hypothetical protein
MLRTYTNWAPSSADDVIARAIADRKLHPARLRSLVESTGIDLGEDGAKA